MSDSSSSAENAGNEEGEPRIRTEYGSNWVGIDGRSMRARRAMHRRRAVEFLEAENARRILEDEQVKEMLESAMAEAETSSAGSPRTSQPSRSAKVPANPRPLLERLHIENLRAFAGPHEIPLAPLTLIYGPNSAGKSTILKGIQLLRDVINFGRRDAIDAWRQALDETSARTLITYSEEDPEDPSGFRARSPLGVGVDFRTQQDRTARVELTYDMNPVGMIDIHRTALGFLGAEAPATKTFIPQDFGGDALPFHPGDFGSAVVPNFVVDSDRGDGKVVRDIRAADAELFAHPSKELQAELFELVYLLRYIGPNRGIPGRAYTPEDGVFNSSWFDFYRKPRIAGFSEFEMLNQMLAQLEIPYEFEQDPRSKLPGALSQDWIMRDVRTNTPVTLDQVGYGVSQLLPVVDVCVHARGQVICVEEPELHLHPRLQARLGNLFATAVVSGGNQVIVETHSESILLRVRRLVRAGKLRPDDVAIIYVDNTTSIGATARRLRLGVQGELLDPWPTGFFDDGLADILGRLS